MKKLIAMVLAIAMCTSLVACGEKENPITEVKLTDVTLEVGETATIEPEFVVPEGTAEEDLHAAVDALEIVYAVTDETVATYADGIITAVAEGETEITATVGEMAATAKIVVKAVPTGVEAPEQLEVALGTTKAIEAKLLPENAGERVLTYSSSDEAIATVDEKGIITPVAVGECVITTRVQGKETEPFVPDYDTETEDGLPVSKTSGPADIKALVKQTSVDEKVEDGTVDEVQNDIMLIMEAPEQQFYAETKVVVVEADTETTNDNKEDVEAKDEKSDAETNGGSGTAKCGSVGHTTEGECPVCGNKYVAPKPTEAPKCGDVGHTKEGKCSVCGNTYTAPKQEVVNPTPQPTGKPADPTPKPTEAPKCGAVGHSTDGTCPVCGAVKTTPKCGDVGHTVDGTCGVCGAVKTTPKCGAVGHSADGTCPVCGAVKSTPQCGSTGHTSGGTCPVCGAYKGGDLDFSDFDRDEQMNSDDNMGDLT